MEWLDGSLGFVVVILVFFAVASLGLPSYRRQQIKMAEIKASSGEQFKELNAEYLQLAQETREAQANMQTDLAAIRASVESMEKMMSDVG
ncbi:MAG: hypothetical protein CVT67_02350 [Actinobacteria bacterium HGW-Actinobacteria-7]|jgi:Tfp pilus assembly protein PilO|nr:MAG: hypothetical protein CVT67_02350 [Actinobacteria bacterium HGW-Actinobacteria-7]